jgi:hypothetical protein
LVSALTHSNAKSIAIVETGRISQDLTVRHVAMFVPMDFLADLEMLSTAYKYSADYDLAMEFSCQGISVQGH